MKSRIFKILCLLSVLLFVFTTFAITAKTKKDKAQEETGPLADLSLSALKFRSVGPALTSGRISDFAVNPADITEYYVAVASGGVWKTTNAGTEFTPVFDSQGSYSIGCVTIDPNDSNVVWVGTGENNNQRSVAYGDGVYKSIDGGKTWKNMGLKNSEHIGMIVVDPRDSNVVYVAAYGPLWSPGGDRGLFMTIDSGKTWEAILTISENTGINEVHLDPRNPDIIYAAAHQRRRHVWTQISGGPESGLHKSKDGGMTWEKINTGFSEDHLGRISIAISPADPDYMYAIVEAQREKGGFYRSLNGGVSWEKRNSYFSSGNYYQELICDPKDPNRVYNMDTYLQVTDDGGKTFRNLGERSKHIDNHCMWINPDNTRHYLVGSDGGVYESFDRGNTWKFMTNLPVTQFYKVAVDNAEPFYNIYGGTQDNYTLGGPSRTISAHGIVSSDWYTTLTGDGFESQIDPVDPNIVYSQAQYGWLVRFDKKSGETMGIQPKPRKGEDSFRWNWDSPLLISPHSHSRLYFAANKLFRSDDYGNTWQVISDDLTRQINRNKLEVMGRIWPMDAVAKNMSTSKYGTIVALDESPLQEDLVYVGTDDGLIQVTEDAGKTWRKVESFAGVPDKTYVNDIIASKHDKNTVFASFNNHKNGDFKPYILKSTDAGRSWTSISADLPERGSVYALDQDHVNNDLLFAGTEFGLFVSVDSGQHWKQMQAGLPTIAVRDIAIQERENDLVLGTFGRGFYVLDDFTPLRYLAQDIKEKDGHIFPVKDTWMFIEKYPLGGLGSKEKGFQGENYYSAPNPPLGATFTYYLKEDIKTLEDQRKEKEKEDFKNDKPVYYPTYEQLRAEQMEEKPYLLFTILDEEDFVVRTLRASASKGIQRMTWDLKYPAWNPTQAKEDPTSSGPSSMFALPGEYKVFMSKVVNGEITKLTDPVSFKAKILGNTTLPAKDRAELVAFQTKVRKLIRAVNAVNEIVDEQLEKINHYKEALKSVTAPHDELAKQIGAMKNSLEEIQYNLFGDQTKRRLDKDTEFGLYMRVNYIIWDQWDSTSAPTQTQRDAYAIAAEAFAPLLQKVKAIAEVDVKKIEQKLEELGAPYTPGRLPNWKDK